MQNRSEEQTEYLPKARQHEQQPDKKSAAHQNHSQTKYNLAGITKQNDFASFVDKAAASSNIPNFHSSLQHLDERQLTLIKRYGVPHHLTSSMHMHSQQQPSRKQPFDPSEQYNQHFR